MTKQIFVSATSSLGQNDQSATSSLGQIDQNRPPLSFFSKFRQLETNPRTDWPAVRWAPETSVSCSEDRTQQGKENGKHAHDSTADLTENQHENNRLFTEYLAGFCDTTTTIVSNPDDEDVMNDAGATPLGAAEDGKEHVRKIHKPTHEAL
mgnify:CR=1 FL=1